jgi:hypothetical protein
LKLKIEQPRIDSRTLGITSPDHQKQGNNNSITSHSAEAQKSLPVAFETRPGPALDTGETGSFTGYFSTLNHR